LAALKLPPEFKQTVIDICGAAGEAWLAELPDLLQAAAERWQLRLGHPLPGMAYNYVGWATREDGSPAVVKIGIPDGEWRFEIAALQAFAGRGTVRLVESWPERRAFLLEALQPGHPLAEEPDEDRAMQITAGLLRQLWTLPPAGVEFPTIGDWAQGLARLRARFAGGTGPFPRALVERAETNYAALLADDRPVRLLNGDVHHWNILSTSSHPAGYAFIDPKGLLGEAEYDLMPWLRNNLPDAESPTEWRARINRRIDRFAELLDFDRQRLRAWRQAELVLSAWWSYEDGGPDAELDAQMLELF
jgi:streptomycin 6-kinase